MSLNYLSWRGLTRVGLVATLALFTSALQAGAEVRFAPERDYAPFVFQASNGEVQGLSVDLLEVLKPALSVTIVTLPTQPLNEILQAAQRGQVDLISSLRPTPERAAYLAFTAPYVQVPAVLVVRQSISPPRLEDLDGQAVAVGRGYAVESYVRQHFGRVRWQAVPDDLSGLRGLMQGRYQGVVADVASVSDAIRRHQVEGVQVVHTIGFDYPLSFAYRKDLPQLGQQLEAALQQVSPQTRQKIVDRWIDAQTLQFEDPKRILLRRVALALALLGVALLINRRRT